MFNLINIRLRDEDSFGNIIQQNILFWALLIGFFVAQILQVDFNTYGGFASLQVEQWLITIGFGAVSSFL